MQGWSVILLDGCTETARSGCMSCFNPLPSSGMFVHKQVSSFETSIVLSGSLSQRAWGLWEISHDEGQHFFCTWKRQGQPKTCRAKIELNQPSPRLIYDWSLTILCRIEFLDYKLGGLLQPTSKQPWNCNDRTNLRHCWKQLRCSFFSYRPRRLSLVFRK